MTRIKRSQVDLKQLPNTGTLRGDLLALFKPSSIREEERKLKAMAGLASLLSQHPEFAEAGNAAIVEPWANVHRILIQRNKERGEIHPETDIETISRVIPSMAGYRALIERRPFTRDFLILLIDAVLIPALGFSAQKDIPT